jgi:PQQ-dependent dehydrogenase (methanol/ethanol family)
LLGLSSTALANESILKSSKDEKNWALQNGDYAGTRYSTLAQINASNVGTLKAAWSFSTGVLRGHEGSPLVVDGVMYVHSPFPNTVYALDLAKDAMILWKYTPKQDPSVIPVMCCDTINRGLALADGKVFLHQADTALTALDAKSGKLIWSVMDGDAKKGETGTSAPLVIKDKVIIGNSGGEFGVRGHITAYDTATGRQVWRAYSVGPDGEILFDPEKTTSLGKAVGKDSSIKTWNGDQWKIGGGAPWGWLSYDPDLNLLYHGTGNPSTWNPAQRAGPDGKPIDEKWATSVIARNPDTGVADWAYQITPFDEWDYDGINEMILVDLDISGQKTPALVHFDRNGFAYTINRKTGEPLVAQKFDPTVNWASHIDLDKKSPNYGRPHVVEKYSTFANGTDVNTRGICPTALGTKGPAPAAYSPKAKLFFVPANQVCMDYEPFKTQYTAGQPYVGATVAMFPTPGAHGGLGSFVAWDAVNGKIAWSKPELFSVWSGALATAGDVVFYGTLEGYLKAVDPQTGRELWKFKTPSGIVGNVFTYVYGGKQYVGAYSGVGGWAGIGLAAGLSNATDGLGAVGGYAALSNYTSLGGTLTVFSLP